jgi:hypothetical protein
MLTSRVALVSLMAGADVGAPVTGVSVVLWVGSGVVVAGGAVAATATGGADVAVRFVVVLDERLVEPVERFLTVVVGLRASEIACS